MAVQLLARDKDGLKPQSRAIPLLVIVGILVVVDVEGLGWSHDVVVSGECCGDGLVEPGKRKTPGLWLGSGRDVD